MISAKGKPKIRIIVIIISTISAGNPGPLETPEPPESIEKEIFHTPDDPSTSSPPTYLISP
jgi:hypothetical protein